jgi:hypothetical protein
MGHYERDCWIRQQQLDSGAARYDERGRAYIVTPSLVYPSPQQTPLGQVSKADTPPANAAPQAPVAVALSKAYMLQAASESQTVEPNPYDYPSHLL